MDAVAVVGLTMYADLFCARLDAFVYDSRTHVNGEVTWGLITRAMRDGHSISGYMARLTDDGRQLTHVGAIDFDKTPADAPTRVRDTLTKMGVPTLLSLSRRGAHLWVVSKDGDGEGGSDKYGDIPASSMRKALTHAIRLTDPSFIEGSEVFPKESSSPWGVGALRLPLMTHPKTGTRFPVIDMDGNRLTKVVDVISTLQYVEWPVIRRLAADAPMEYPRQLGEYRRQVLHTEVGSAVALLSGLGLTAVAGHSVRCPFHDDRHASLSVAPDDERVWCKSPTCPAYNGGRGVGTLGLARMIATRRG